MLEHPLVQHLRRDQRHQADQRADPERLVPVVHVELVVVEAVVLAPQPRAAERVDGLRDGDEVLEELGGEILVRRVFARELQGHGQHRVAVERHPGGAVGLLQMAAGRQRAGTVEDADVVESEEAAGEEVPSLRVLPVDPPGEVEQQLLERALEERVDRAGPWRRSSCTPASRPTRVPAGSRRRRRTRRPGIWPFGCMYHSRSSSSSCSLAKWGSMRANGIM